MNILEDYVSFECAKLLKKKGFNSKCIAYYLEFNENIKFYECNNLGQSLPYISNDSWGSTLRNPLESGYTAPTLQMAMKWLRLTHKIYIQAFAPLYDMDCAKLGVTYNVIITNLTNQCLAFDTPLDDIEYNSPEEAHEAALKYCLENLI